MNNLCPPDIQGFFWLPDKPDDYVPGRLYCTDRGHIELEAFDNPSGFSLDGTSNALYQATRILGISAKGKLITLEDCSRKEFRDSHPGLSVITLHVGLVLIGCHFSKDEPIEFEEIACHSESFDEWFRFGKIQTSHDETFKSRSINYMRPTPLEAPLSIGGQLILACSHKAPSVTRYRSASISQATWLGLRFTEHKPLEELLTLLRRLCNFISFAVDQTLPMQGIRAYSKKNFIEVSGKKRRQLIDIYYNQNIRSTPDLSHIKTEELFSFESVRDRFGNLISNWFEHYDAFNSSFDLYFATRSGRDLYMENYFLMLVYALETLHRKSTDTTIYTDEEYKDICSRLKKAAPSKFKEWLESKLRYGNEPSLRMRFKQLFGKAEPLFLKAAYANAESIGEIISLIVDTRNYLTHHDESLRLKAADFYGQDRLCQAMEVLFKFHIAKLCGFSDEEIVGFFKRRYGVPLAGSKIAFEFFRQKTT